MTEARFETLSPTVGDQEYVEPPEAVKPMDPPEQILAVAGDIVKVRPPLKHVAAE